MARRFTTAQLRGLQEASEGKLWVWYGTKKLGQQRNHWVVGGNDMHPNAYDWLYIKGYINMSVLDVDDEQRLAYITTKGRDELDTQLKLWLKYQAERKKNREKTAAASEAFRPRREP